MSITRGIEIVHIDGKADSVKCVSWKNRSIDFWISEYLFHPASKYPVIERTKGCFRCQIPEEILRKMADDMINRRFEVCPDSYDDIVDKCEEEAEMFGQGFLDLIEKLEEGDMLVYYDAGQ